MRRIDLARKRFGKWLVIARDVSDARFWVCRCDCGQRGAVCTADLVRGHSRGCRGCSHVTHGAARQGKHTPEYRIWRGMHHRCSSRQLVCFKHYGGRGIRVCDRWQSFEAFLADMGPRPSSRHSIDRIDNDGNYEPQNCRWATQDLQAQNCRRTVMNQNKVRSLRRLRARGVALAALSIRFGISESAACTIASRKTWRNVA